MRIRETIAARVERLEAVPVDEDALLAEGCFRNTKTAAAFSGISSTQLTAAMNAGRLPYVRDGRARHITKVGLRLFMRARLVRRADLTVLSEPVRRSRTRRNEASK
jgi:hypothetical protein